MKKTALILNAIPILIVLAAVVLYLMMRFS